MQKTKILLVEDDISMGFLLAEYLEEKKFEVKLCKDGESGLMAWKSGDYDFCIFDIMLPKLDGYSLIKKVRERNKEVPIILLTAKSMKEDKIQGFNLGVDDYITKPFDEEELLCRINAIQNRVSLSDKKNETTQFEIGKYNFDYSNQMLRINSQSKRLTKKENEVLKLLCLSKNRITKRDDILLSVWNKSDYFTGRSLDVFITKLRKYLNEDKSIKIEGIPTVGYILSED
jgi:DNA-binding response OmpR family regulator